MTSGKETSSSSPMLVSRQKGSYLFTDHSHRFVAIADDKQLPAIIAYGIWTDDILPPPVQAFLNTMEDVNPERISKETKRESPVAPLLSFVRHQKSPYNALCPYYTYDDGTQSEERCVVGCVATALEEVISYYRRTITLQDTLHGWTTDHYAISDILPGTSVDCRLIADNYDTGDYTPQQSDAVARLSYYCGVAARMNWGLSESGARVSRLPQPLREAFGMGFVVHADSYRYTPETWTEMIKNEIRNKRPVLYAGYTMSMSGHAFVVDGLDQDGFFHVNWGYGGNYDGYFRLDLLNFAEPKHDLTQEGAYNGFFCNQEALLLHPDPIAVTLPDTLARTGREIAVDSVTFICPPEIGKLTPLLLHLRNTTEQALTTPFEIFTNEPNDTVWFEQGDYNALTGCSLAPGERISLPVHVRFNESGRRTLRISPDDVAVVYEKEVNIASGTPPLLTFETPVLSFPEEGKIDVSVTVSNASTAGRAAQNLHFELYEGPYRQDAEGTRHNPCLFLDPGESTTVGSTFFGAIPGKTYTLLIRSPWEIVGQSTFEVPIENSLPRLTQGAELPEVWYDLQGRQTGRPTSPGVYIRKLGNGDIQKIWLRPY